MLWVVERSPLKLDIFLLNLNEIFGKLVAVSYLRGNMSCVGYHGIQDYDIIFDV